VDGRTLKLAGAGKLPPTGREEAIRAAGGSTPQVYELDPSEAKTFRDQMLKVKARPEGASVEVYDEADYAKMRLFTTQDGLVGAALRGDEMISLFSLPGAPKRVARHMVATQIAQGGRRGDAFDTVLPKLYTPEGFAPVARMPWNDEFAPDGWDYSFYQKYNGGRPDVVFMAYDPARVDTEYVPGEGEMLGPDDYNLGVAKAQRAAAKPGAARPRAARHALLRPAATGG
jgi:hypothetical protein